MTKATVAAVQAAYVLMEREATLEKTEVLLKEAATNGANLVAFPEVFVPGTPLWIDSGPIWEGDEACYAMLVDQAVVVPSPVTERLALASNRLFTSLQLLPRPGGGPIRTGPEPSLGEAAIGLHPSPLGATGLAVEQVVVLLTGLVAGASVVSRRAGPGGRHPTIIALSLLAVTTTIAVTTA
jgi:hypothetical protein